MAETVKCPFCEKMADPAKQNCPHCGGPLGFEYKPDAAQIPTVAKPIEPIGALKPPPTTTDEAQRTCPACGAKAGASDIICIQCGTNLLIKHQANAQIHRRSAPAINPKVYIAAAAIALFAAGALLTGYFLLSNPLDKARALARTGSTLEAINVTNAHLQRKPDDTNAQLLLGKLYWKSQQYEPAANAFYQALLANPANADAGMMAALALARSAAPPAQQAEMLETVVQHHPNNAQAWHLLALARGAQGNYTAQAEAIERAIAAGKDPGTLALMLAIAQAMAGNTRPALTTLAAAYGSNDIDAVDGMIAYMAGQQDRALASLERASGKGTTLQAVVDTRLGLLLLSEGKVEPAHELLMKAADTPNAPSAALFFDAVCLQARGATAEAIKAFEHVMDTRKEYAQEAAMQLALLYLRQGNPDQANNTLKHARQLGDESARLLTLEGQALLYNNAVEDARERFLAAIKRDPTYPAAHLEYGLMQIAQGDLRGGLLELERFLTLTQNEKGLPQVNEIELLVNQLKSSAGQNRPLARAEGAAQ